MYIPMDPLPAPERLLELLQPGPGDPLVGYFGREKLEALVQGLLSHVVTLEARVAALENEPEADDEEPDDGA